MGVESKFYILPESSGYRPAAGKIAGLIREFRAAGFLFDPDSPSSRRSAPALASDGEGFQWKLECEEGGGSLAGLEQRMAGHDESDIFIRWENPSLVASGLKYPLSVIPDPDGVYYDIEFHLAADTVYHTSEIIDPFAEIHCTCGASIEEIDPPEEDFFYSARLPNRCPACQQQTNFALLPMTVHDAWTGAESERKGGVTYRFAIVVDCGKCLPDGSANISPEFLGIMERCLAQKVRVFRDFY